MVLVWVIWVLALLEALDLPRSLNSPRKLNPGRPKTPIPRMYMPRRGNMSRVSPLTLPSTELGTNPVISLPRL